MLSSVHFYSAGETTYNLDTAGGLRLEVQKYYELIDALRYMAVMTDSFKMKLLSCLPTMPLLKIKLASFLFSKKILTLGLKDDPQPHPKVLQLQKMIRYTATLFVQVRTTSTHTLKHDLI